jgi:hypothetical protein
MAVNFLLFLMVFDSISTTSCDKTVQGPNPAASASTSASAAHSLTAAATSIVRRTFGQTHDNSEATSDVCKMDQLSLGRWIWAIDGPNEESAGTTETQPVLATKPLLLNNSATHCGIAWKYKHDLAEQAGRENHGEKPWGKYCWRPHRCTTHVFSKDRMCEVLNGRSLLIIGDSINYMFYQAIFMQLEIDSEPLGQWDLNSNFSSMCDGKSKLKYVRNDQLSTSPGQFQYDWWSHIKNYDIVLANKGDHVVGDYSAFQNQTRDSAVYFASLMRHSNKTFIFRTTPTGHPYCSFGDVASVEPIFSHDCVRYVLFNESSAFNEYLWYKIPSRDQETVRIFRKYIPDMLVLDVVPMTSLRPDGHRAPGDCLHYYLPSAVDHWLFLLYNMLKIHASQGPILKH